MSYSPVVGRFMQRDPLGYVDGASLYQYEQGRVTQGGDPQGQNMEPPFEPPEPQGPPTPLDYYPVREVVREPLWQRILFSKWTPWAVFITVVLTPRTCQAPLIQPIPVPPAPPNPLPPTPEGPPTPPPTTNPSPQQ